MMETKSIVLEVKDFSSEKRTAVIAHAVYNNIDRVGDISTKGMFNSSWKRNDPISFYFNHEPNAVPGKVMRTFEDEQKAYTEVKFGNWTLGNDVMEMVDMGVIKGASFGYSTEKKDFIEKDGRKIRKLLQVKHIETSLLTMEPANPLAGVVSLNKAAEQDAVEVLRKHYNVLDNFCRNSHASDETIILIQNQADEIKQFLSSYDTGSTHLIDDGEPSSGDNGSLIAQLLLFNQRLTMAVS